MTPFLEWVCSQCSPLIGEYVFDFAVVLFGVGLLLPHVFHAQAKINLFGPFSDPAPSSGAVRRDTASTHAHTHHRRHIAVVLCNVRRSYSRLTLVMIDRIHAHPYINRLWVFCCFTSFTVIYYFWSSSKENLLPWKPV